MAVYYVSTAGNDSNDGLSKDTALLTVEAAIDKVSEVSTINILAGTYEIKTYLGALSKASYKITLKGIPGQTIFLMPYCGVSANARGKADFINIIFKASNNPTNEKRFLSYSSDFTELKFYNCVFSKSDNGTYPTSHFFCFYSSEYVTTFYNKYFYNCIFDGKPFSMSGHGAVYNCASNSSFSYATVTNCKTGAIFDENYKITNYDNDIYGVYSNASYSDLDYNYSWSQCCIKMNDKYYSILDNFYNTETQMYEAFDSIEDIVFFDLKDIFVEVTIGEETFTPINKFTGNVQFLFSCKTSSVELTGHKTYKELILGEMIDLRLFSNIQSLSANNDLKMVFCINESKWYTYDFDSGSMIALDINIPLNKSYDKFTIKEKNNWNEAAEIIDAQGFSASRLSEIDFNKTDWKTIRVAYVIGTNPFIPETHYESVSTLPTSCQSGYALVYNDEIHIVSGAYHYKWNGISWTQASTHNYSFYNGCGVVYNNEIHVFGGSSMDYDKQCHCKWDGKAWTQISILPFTTHGASATVYNNEIHIFGGAKNEKSHHKWDGKTWTKLEDLPLSHCNGMSIVYNDTIYLFTDTYVHKWDGENWEQVEKESESYEHGSVVIFNNKIHVMTKNTHTIWDGESYNIKSHSQDIGSMENTTAVVYKNKIHMFIVYNKHYTYSEDNCNYVIEGSKFSNSTQDALVLFNSTEVGFENEQDGFSKTCENKQFPIFSDNASRIKTQDGVASDWWLNTNVEVDSSQEVTTVSSDGTLDSSKHNAEKGVCFGFNI